jgi:hypothetical protein
MSEMTFALLIYRTTPAQETLTDTGEAEVLLAHRRLQAELSEQSDLHAVARLQEPERARAIRYQDGTHEISDGPYMETKEWLVGFYLVRCQDENQAMDRAKTICMDKYHAIEVRPVLWEWKA